MKLFLYFISIFACLVIPGCKEKDLFNRNVCGVLDPASELSWLSDIIEKAEEDKESQKYQGNYIGTIYIETYNSEKVFLVNMAMGSGGVIGYVFDCEGKAINFNNDQIKWKFFSAALKRMTSYTAMFHKNQTKLFT